MRSQTQVQPFALAVDRNIRVTGQRLDMFRLEVFALVLEETDRLVAVPYLTGDGLVPADDFLHALFDRHQVFGRKGFFAIKIVIKPILDGRAEGHLYAGIKFLYGFGHDMGGVVPQQLQRFLAVTGDNGDRGVAVDHMGQVFLRAVNDKRERGLGEARADGGGDLGAANRFVEFADAAVRKRDGYHDFCNNRDRFSSVYTAKAHSSAFI